MEWMAPSSPPLGLKLPATLSQKLCSQWLAAGIALEVELKVKLKFKFLFKTPKFKLKTDSKFNFKTEPLNSNV